MREWILSIIGVVFIDLILDVLLPSGKTTAFIKSILAIAFMYVIISPIFRLDINNFVVGEGIIDEYLVGEEYGVEN